MPKCYRGLEATFLVLDKEKFRDLLPEHLKNRAGEPLYYNERYFSKDFKVLSFDSLGGSEFGEEISFEFNIDEQTRKVFNNWKEFMDHPSSFRDKMYRDVFENSRCIIHYKGEPIKAIVINIYPSYEEMEG